MSVLRSHHHKRYSNDSPSGLAVFALDLPGICSTHLGQLSVSVSAGLLQVMNKQSEKRDSLYGGGEVERFLTCND